jgi:Putative transposase
MDLRHTLPRRHPPAVSAAVGALPLRNKDWVVYAKRPFGGPQELLRYLARYTHRVAISNRRLISADDKGVTFKWMRAAALKAAENGIGWPQICGFRGLRNSFPLGLGKRFIRLGRIVDDEVSAATGERAVDRVGGSRCLASTPASH